MKTLYYLSKLLSLPFYIIVAILNVLSLGFEWIADFIHDQTEYPIWLHLNLVKDMQSAKAAQPVEAGK